LEDALKEIELRTDCTIILANQAAESKKTPITARFTNVPVDTAVAAVAEMAGLKMVRNGNVLLVTTAARADEFKRVSLPSDQSSEDLKKKIAELEKTIGELKQKK